MKAPYKIILFYITLRAWPLSPTPVSSAPCMATVTHTRLLCTVHGHCHPHPSPLHRAWPLSPTPVSSAPCMATVTHTRLLYTVHSHCHPHPSPLHRAWPLSPTPVSSTPCMATVTHTLLLLASQSQCRSLFWMPCRLLDTVQALARCRTASRHCPLLTHRHVSTR